MSLIIQKWKLKFVFAGCGIPQCYHTLLVLVCFVFQISVCYMDRLGLFKLGGDMWRIYALRCCVVEWTFRARHVVYLGIRVRGSVQA